MPLPERLQPAKVNRQKLKQLADMAEEILAQIDNGAKEEDAGLKMLINDWNSGLLTRMHSLISGFLFMDQCKDFTRMAFNQEKYVADLSRDELIQIIQFVCQAEGKESEQSYALGLLEKNFDANPSDLIYWPNEWFQDKDMLHVDLTPEEIAGYLMAKSGRRLSDAPQIELKYPIPSNI